MSQTIDPAVSLHAFDRRHLAQTLTWTNDADLARLLGRLRTVEPDEHERWFAGLAGRVDTIFFAIQTGSDEQHVGNVWLADIDRRHQKAEVRVVIGTSKHRGAGLGTRALDLIARYAFETLGLHRVYAYVMSFNPRARRSFEKAGFVLEGTLRGDRWNGTGYDDTWLLARLADDR